MRTISFSDSIANAAARLDRTRGTVTQRARDAGYSRQTVYIHARKVVAAVEAECGGGKTREALIEQLESLFKENAQLWEWLESSIEFPPAKQQEFTVKAMAMGLSNNQIRELMVVLLGTKASPSRSTIHRWIQAAGTAATRVLAQLDRRCRELILTGCLDEIFFRGRPVLVGVEPHSMAWFLGKKAENHQGSTWFTELQSWNPLRSVISDGGSGLQAGIAQLQRQQRAANQPPVEKGLDVFHIKQAAKKALSTTWTKVEQSWERADSVGRALKRARWQGKNDRKLKQQLDDAWSKAFSAFKLYEKVEAVWKRVAPAFDIFRPDGQLNDRAWAQEQVAWGLSRLRGPEWSRVRGFLQNEEAFTFLDQLHDRMDRLPLPETLRDALLRLWWVRRQLPRKSAATAVAGYRYAACLAQEVLCAKLDPNWRESYRRVAAVLRQTVRASSAVECMNSVLRMHQARHRTVTQPMLDVKRLYWNTRVFHGGKRKGLCPYEHLGLKLPSYDFWTLLHSDAVQEVEKPDEISAKPRSIAA
jgi:AcrR family transcriptional regulator